MSFLRILFLTRKARRAETESCPTGRRHFALPAANHFALGDASLQRRTLNKLHPLQCRPACFGAAGAITQRIVEKNVKRVIGKLVSTK
jgi:transposase